jgi:hypothetical protein
MGGKIVRRMRNASPETVMQTQHLAQIRETTISGNGAHTISLFSVSDCRRRSAHPPGLGAARQKPRLGGVFPLIASPQGLDTRRYPDLEARGIRCDEAARAGGFPT